MSDSSLSNFKTDAKRPIHLLTILKLTQKRKMLLEPWGNISYRIYPKFSDSLYITLQYFQILNKVILIQLK